MPAPHPKKGFWAIKLITDLKITILGEFIKNIFPNLSKTFGKKLAMFGLIIGKVIFIKINNVIGIRINRILLAPKNINKDGINPKNAFLELVNIIKVTIVEEIKNAERFLIKWLEFFSKKYKEKGKLTANQKPA